MNQFLWGAICGVWLSVAVIWLFIGIFGLPIETGRQQMFLDIANQRCAPQVALISADNPYRYVCVGRDSK